MTRKKLTSLFSVVFMAGAAFAVDDTMNNGFYLGLEMQLRTDYRECTGDTSHLPLKTLITWKHLVDSLIGLPGFPSIVKEYEKETGGSAVKDRPCAVVQWKHRRDSSDAQKNRLEAQRKKQQEAAAVDSLAVRKEVVAARALPCCIVGIPFGISRHAFEWLFNRTGFDSLYDKKAFLYCPNVTWGTRRYTAAFYFDRQGRFYKYELESPALAVDMLDDVIRPEAERLAAVFEGMIHSPPLRTSRIGRREIIPGRLSLYKVWSENTWSVSIGLAQQKYRYYAKAVAVNNPLPNVEP